MFCQCPWCDVLRLSGVQGCNVQHLLLYLLHPQNEGSSAPSASGSEMPEKPRMPRLVASTHSG